MAALRTTLLLVSFSLLFLAPVFALAVDPRFAIDLGLLGQTAKKPDNSKLQSGKSSASAPKKMQKASAGAKHRSVRKKSEYTPGNAGTLSFAQRLRGSGTNGASYNLDGVRLIWPALVATQTTGHEPIEVTTENFSLSIDPSRYITLPTADGARILLDPAGEIPPMVRSLVESSDARVRIVTENPALTRSFYGAVLAKAHFYSVTENFALEYGQDPKLTVTSDFMVEKGRDSILSNDLVLLSINPETVVLPPSLHAFLKQEGYTMATPVTSRNSDSQRTSRGIICTMGTGTPEALADRLLNALVLPVEKDRHIDLYGETGKGISLSIRADRTFKESGQEYVISTFKGDPVHYTLMRLLETQGYRVIMLAPEDDFRRVSEKILSRLKIPARLAVHDLFPDAGQPYGIKMSGFMLKEGRNSVFLTDREIPSLHQDLLNLNGYTILRP
jgi:hypothetical protein